MFKMNSNRRHPIMSAVRGKEQNEEMFHVISKYLVLVSKISTWQT